MLEGWCVKKRRKMLLKIIEKKGERGNFQIKKTIIRIVERSSNNNKNKSEGMRNK